MKLLFLISRFLDGGIDTVLVEYLNALCEYTTHEVSLAIRLKHDELEVYLPRLDGRVKVHYLVDEPRLTWVKQRAVRGGKTWWQGLYDELLLNPIRTHLAHKRLARLMEETDVVVDFDCCQGSLLEGIRSSVRRICYYHFSLLKEKERSPRRFARTLQKFVHYDRVVLISKAMQEEAQTLCPHLEAKWEMIYNPVSLQRLQAKAQEPVDSPLIKVPFLLAVERLEESQKDITTLIKAYELLKEETAVPPLYIIGKGRDELLLQQKIEERGLAERVRLLGFQSNPAPWMAAAQFVVHSSKFEGLPTVLIEALMLGKVIVSSDCPTGPREILDEGRAGLLVEPGNARAMAEALKTLCKDEALAERLREGVIRHRTRFLPETVVRQFEELLH